MFKNLAAAANGTVGPAQMQFSVNKYGAVCDGSTNDSTAIQAAITAAAVTGGNVVLPAATCNFSTTLTRPRNVMIVGQGRNSSYLNYTGSTRAFVLGDVGANNPPSWKGGFQHLSLEGPSSTGSTIGLYLGADPAGVISPTGTLDDDEEWLDFAVQKFGIGATVNNNAYLLTAIDFLDANNNQLWKDVSTNTNAGERMSFVSSIFGQSQSTSLYAIELDNNLGDYYFTNSSIDYNNTSIADVGCIAGNLHATFTNVHFEKSHGERIHINNSLCNGEVHIFGGEMTTTGTGTTDNDMIGLTGAFTSQNVVTVIGTAVNSNETLTSFIDANNPVRIVTVDSLGWENFGNLNACVNNEGNPLGITVRNTQGCASVVGDAGTTFTEPLNIGTATGTSLNGAFITQYGSNNVFLGGSTPTGITGTGEDTGVGVNSLHSCTTCATSVGVGQGSLYFTTTPANLVAIGYNSGAFIANGSTDNVLSSNSVYIGTFAYPLASGDVNENVFGYAAIGAGSNTTTLGTSSTVATIINGVIDEPVATIASATTIAPVTPMVITSGSTSIATITLPTGFTTGCIDLVPSGTQATTTAGNIAAVYTLTSGTLYRACYQGTKWYIK